MEQRELKFRAWHPDFGEMVYADMNNIIYEKREFMMQFDVGFSNYPESGWSIMQFTGLKDKNGKEIYEGDIVKIDWIDTRYKTQIGVVEWDSDASQFTFGSGSVSEVNWSHEVIGNIHQNPELLK